ncbi:MAG: glutaredoxin family protein [Desulfarculus sp.]|jgi:glutaredoxin|nr:MAG: glutaredoxin family protein [Desulfarculus sp.]
MSEPVKLYALSTCSHCKNTKKLLDELGVKYDVVEVDLCQGDERDRLVSEVKKYNPNCSFPTLLVGDKVIVGYREQDIKEALGL